MRRHGLHREHLRSVGRIDVGECLGAEIELTEPVVAVGEIDDAIDRLSAQGNLLLNEPGVHGVRGSFHDELSFPVAGASGSVSGKMRGERTW